MKEIGKTNKGTSKKTRSSAKKRQWVFVGTPESANVYPTFQGSTPSMPTPFRVVGKATPRQEDYKPTS